jgi:hypothetical protein
MADEPKPNLSEPTKTEIWREVERRFEHPPDKFAKQIQAEIKQQLDEREKYYRGIGKTVLIIGSICAVIVAGASIWSAISTAYKISESRAAQSIARIETLRDKAQTQSDEVNTLSQSTKKDVDEFETRLGQIKKKDNVVLADELPQVFVHEKVKNLSGDTITLDYEPIADTIRIFWGGHLTDTSPSIKIDGAKVTFPNAANQLAPWTNSDSHVTIEYVRKLRTQP